MKQFTITLDDRILEDISRTDHKIVTQIASLVLGKVADFYNVPKKMYEGRYPQEIKIKSKETRVGFDKEKNCFIVDDLDTFLRKDYLAEEHAHFLRELYVKDSADDVQEFFGGLSKLVIGGADYIALDDVHVLVEKLRASNDKIGADYSQFFTDIAQAVEKDEPDLLLEELRTDVEATLRVLKKVKAGYMNNPLTEEIAGLAYNLIDTETSLSEEVKDELKKKILEPNGLSRAIIEAQNLRRGIDDKIISGDDRREGYETQTLKNGHTKVAADYSVYKTEMHQIGYNMAQKLYDSGTYEALLRDHPHITRLPDENVREIVKAYIPKERILKRLKAKLGAKK